MHPIQPHTDSNYSITLPILFGGTLLIGLAVSNLCKKITAPEKTPKSVTFSLTTKAIAPVDPNSPLNEVKKIIEELIEETLLKSHTDLTSTAQQTPSDSDWVSVDKENL